MDFVETLEEMQHRIDTRLNHLSRELHSHVDEQIAIIRQMLFSELEIVEIRLARHLERYPQSEPHEYDDFNESEA
jgi:hypothetical protein